MTPQLERLKEYCQQQVDNHSIYVWAAEGQMEPTVNEEWIRESEKNTGGNYASIAVGFWNGTEEIRQNWEAEHVFKPEMDENARNAHIKGWKRAVRCALAYTEED